MNGKSIFSLVVAGIIAIVAISTLSGSFYTVDEGERAVVVSQGKISNVSQPGLHFKTPFIEERHLISVRTQALEFLEEPVYTGDRQTATVSFSVNYAVIPTDNEIINLYREFQTIDGLESRALKRQIREQVKNVFGKFTAETAIRERGRLNAEVTAAIANIGDKLIKIEGVNLENINFSDVVERAAEDRAKAEMATNTRKEDQKKAIVDNAMAVAAAQAEADSQLARATASAKAVELAGAAEASAIRAKSDALRDSPNLVELTKAQQWDGKLPTSFVPGSTIPFLKIQ